MLSWIDQEGGLTDLPLQPVPSDQPRVISIFTLSGQEQDPVTQGSARVGRGSRTGRWDGTKLLQKNWSVVRIWLQFQQKISIIASLTGPGVG